MKDIVLKRTITLVAIGVLCLLVGLAYGINADDKMFIGMSIILCGVNLYKVWDIRRIEKKNKYITFCGKCVESSYNLVGKYRVYQIQSGEELFEVSVPKTIRLNKNKDYIFYFKEMNQAMLEEGNWLRDKLLSENFIGYEIMEEKKGVEE